MTADDHDRAAFIRAHLRSAPVRLVPEVILLQAEEPIGLWELTEGEYRSQQPPPFWAFAWAGGQGLAAYLLDHPDEVAGRVVLDLASGSGLVAIVSMLAGASAALAVDIDPLAAAAIERNAAVNNVRVSIHLGDVLDGGLQELGLSHPVVLAGDVFYSQDMSRRVLTFLRRAARDGADVLVGDPGRAYFPTAYFQPLLTIPVPVRPELESTNERAVTVYRMNPHGGVTGA
jgi:predicted nicotinamide N-methyase